MKTALTLLFILAATPASARCHRIWHYPYPDPGCRTTARAPVHRYVRVVQAAPVQPATREIKMRTITDIPMQPSDIPAMPPMTDEEMHKIGVEKMKVEIAIEKLEKSGPYKESK